MPVICLVDDDESVRESVTGLLRACGLQALPFASAEEFLAAEERARADCLIMDVTMPGMSGVELQERLLLEQPSLPIIFVTARVEEALRARLMARGAVACLVKPFEEEDLLSALDVAISRR